MLGVTRALSFFCILPNKSFEVQCALYCEGNGQASLRFPSSCIFRAVFSLDENENKIYPDLGDFDPPIRTLLP